MNPKPEDDMLKLLDSYKMENVGFFLVHLPIVGLRIAQTEEKDNAESPRYGI